MGDNGRGYLENFYAGWAARLAEAADHSIDDLRSLFDEWHRPALEAEGVSYASDAVGGVPTIWALPREQDGGLIIYCHGGGYMVGSADSHRKLGGHLARHLKYRAAVIDYRRAPENPFPAAIDDAVSVYRALREQFGGTIPIVIAGDSAGGNLAIATTLKLRELGEKLPDAVIVFSPWLDMAVSGDTVQTNDATDLLVKQAMVEQMAAAYLGGESPTNPLANPLHADLTGFPPTYINAGSFEILLSDSTRFADAAKEAGVDVTLTVVEGMQHVFPCAAGRETFADDELIRVAAWFVSLRGARSTV